MTTRLPCKLLPWNCSGTQPRANAPCVSPGVWFLSGSVVITPTAPITITGNTTVQGNLTVPLGTTITVRVGSVVTVDGCVTISGNLVVDASGRTISNGSQIDLINFNSSCNGTTDFTSVTVSGATLAKCQSVSANDVLSTKGLSLVFQVTETPNCDGTPGTTVPGGESNNQTAIIAGSIAGAVLFLFIVGFILLYVFRARIIPSYRMTSRMRKIRTGSYES